MIIRIEPDSDIPIYTQITNQIIEGIARGNLHFGDSLPSVRAFAGDLGVNMHTVNKSYHELEKKGIIRIMPKSGAMICSAQELKDKASLEKLSEAFRPLVAEAMVLGMEKEQIGELMKSIFQSITEKES